MARRRIHFSKNVPSDVSPGVRKSSLRAVGLAGDHVIGERPVLPES